MVHRGHGLQYDICGYFEKPGCEGHYRVTGLADWFVHERYSVGQRRIDMGSLPVPMKGTLIEWNPSLGGS